MKFMEHSVDMDHKTEGSIEGQIELPPYWKGGDFYLMGLQFESNADCQSFEVDLSQYEFETPRLIWILIGDELLNHLPRIYKRLHKKSRVLIMLHPEVLDIVQWKDLFFLSMDDRFYFVPMQEVSTQAGIVSGLMDDEKFDVSLTCWLLF